MKRSSERVWAWVLAAPLGLLLVAPSAALLASADRAEMSQALRDPLTRAAFQITLEALGVSLVVLLACGTGLAYTASRSRAISIWQGVIGLPAALPPAVAGLGLLVAFGQQSPLGMVLRSLGIGLPFTFGAVVLAQVVVSAPFYVLPVCSAFASQDADLASSWRLDGASEFVGFARVAIPAVRMPMLSALCVAGARGMGEFGATLLFAGNFPGRTQTLSLAVYDAFGFEPSRSIALAIWMLLMGSGLYLVGAVALNVKKLR